VSDGYQFQTFLNLVDGAIEEIFLAVLRPGKFVD